MSNSKSRTQRVLLRAILSTLLTAGIVFAEDSASVASKSETTLAGYGEIGYNNYSHDQSRDLVDLKRFVIFLGHRFNDQLRFNSEVEWEHAVTSFDDQGESEIEQAYLNYEFSQKFNVKMGLFLMPFGLLNQNHEPPVFNGVERNEVETRIIPSTWREGGIGFDGNTDFGLNWDAGLTTGFDLAKMDDASFPLAASHQELQLAKAANLSWYGALNYVGLPGFIAGGAIFTGNTIQDNADFKSNGSLPDFGGIDGRLVLWDAHTRWQQSGWDIQAVYARGTIDQADAIDAVLQIYDASATETHPFVPKAFDGWLVQGGYTFWFYKDMSVNPFARYETYNTQASMPAGFSADPMNQDKVVTAGFSFKPITQVVIKMDYHKFMDNSTNDRFNVGLGYMF